MSRTIGALIGGAALALSCSVQAAALCSAGDTSTGISFGDVSFVDPAGNRTIATDCYGVVQGVATAAMLGDYGGSAFAPVIATVAPGQTGVGQFGDLSFTLSTTGFGLDSGTWSLGWSGALPSTLDIVAVIQSTFVAGPSFASYLFDALPATGGLSGRWVINFGNLEDLGSLSQFAIYARDTAPTPPPPPTPTPVDEPATAALLAVAAFGLAIVRRRRSRA